MTVFPEFVTPADITSAPQMPIVGLRFPPPWSFEDENGARYVIRNHNGFAISCVCITRPSQVAGQRPTSSTPAHLLRVEEAGSLAPPLLTFRLAF